MDYIENYKFSPFLNGGGGVPLHYIPETQDTMLGGNSLSHLSIPGGLFISDYFSFETFEKYIEEDITKMNVFDNFDVFIDLVSPSSLSSTNSKTKKKHSKIKKKISYKYKQKIH